MHMLGKEVKHLLIGVTLVSAHVNDKVAFVGHDIMLTAGIDNRHAHLRRSQERADPLKLIVAQP